MKVKGVEEEQDGIDVPSCSFQKFEKDSVGNGGGFVPEQTESCW